MDYLYEQTRVVAGTLSAPAITAAGKHVIVIGGGDTGADCVASAHREEAASVTQIELLGEPPVHRPDELTPWPLWPMKLRTSYALKEGGERSFAVSTTELTGSDAVEQIHWRENTGTPPFEPVPGTEESHPAELVLLAMGFTGPEPALLEQLGVERDGRGSVAATEFATTVPGVFAAGDARRGQSLIVWAIDEGRRCARAVDAWLAEDGASAAAPAAATSV
jgi:glutamate synthase (NADPH) small chain